MTRAEAERRDQVAMAICEAGAPHYSTCTCKRDGRAPALGGARACIASLKAADAVLTLPAEDRWRPIAEAPKDGRYLLLRFAPPFLDRNSPGVAVGCWTDHRWWLTAIWAGGDPHKEPTDFHPLPAHPDGGGTG